jgi:MraZ protein
MVTNGTIWGEKFQRGKSREKGEEKMEATLCGSYEHSIDVKGRMSFPTKLRDILGPEFYLCIGHDDKFIAVYSPEKFEEYQEKLSSIPGKKGSDLRRKLLSCCDRQIPDKQGRILIPPQLRKHALLEKDVVVIGASNHAEIWDKKLWDEFNERVTVDDLSDALEDLVL